MAISCFDGKCQAVAFGDLVPGFRVCHVYMEGSLEIQELWNQPPTSPIRQGGQDAVALDILANAGGIFEDTEIVTRYIFRGFDLQHRQLVVPPQGTARIEVTSDLDCFVRDGVGQFIFHNDGQVLVPGVLIGVL